MDKIKIFNQYAIEQGYESWVDLFQKCEVYIEIMIHVDNVTDLIQEELKKKIAKIEDIYVEDFDEFGDAYVVIGTDKKSILNTEIL